jgi:hypothetical protein
MNYFWDHPNASTRVLQTAAPFEAEYADKIRRRNAMIPYGISALIAFLIKVFRFIFLLLEKYLQNIRQNFIRKRTLFIRREFACHVAHILCGEEIHWGNPFNRLILNRW